MFPQDFHLGIASGILPSPQDLALLRLLSIGHVKIVLSWPMLFPNGNGEPDREYAEYFRTVLRAMKKCAIKPVIVLFDGDIPEHYKNCGGFRNPESPEWFASYAKWAAQEYSPDCDTFLTMSDPPCASFLEAHNLLKAHGKAVLALRENAAQTLSVGFAKSATEVFPFSSSTEDIDAARDACFAAREDAGGISVNLSWFMDPLCFGTYPGEDLSLFEEELPEITEADMNLIRQPLDFLGLNLAKNAEPVAAAAMFWVSRFVYEKYQKPLLISCKGILGLDCVSTDGQVHDANRVALLENYLGALQKAVNEGILIKGFYMEGFQNHRGLIFADEEAGIRIVKDSAYWYADAAASCGNTLAVNRKARQILFLEADEKGNVDLTSWIREGLYAGLTLDEVLHEMPELFGGVNQPPAVQEMITLEIEGEASFLQDQPYLYVTVAAGEGLLNGHLLCEGDHFILPSDFGEARFRGELTLLVSARVAIVQ